MFCRLSSHIVYMFQCYYCAQGYNFKVRKMNNLFTFLLVSFPHYLSNETKNACKKISNYNSLYQNTVTTNESLNCIIWFSVFSFLCELHFCYFLEIVDKLVLCKVQKENTLMSSYCQKKTLYSLLSSKWSLLCHILLFYVLSTLQCVNNLIKNHDRNLPHDFGKKLLSEH